MALTRISHAGKSWPINEFVAACLAGESSFPAPIAATIIRHIQAYNNHQTISASSLHAECDYKPLLERSIDYTQDIEDLWHASFRGANVHGLLETCRDDPRFKDWLFEKRFFAVLTPEDEIYPLKEILSSVQDWEFFDEMCHRLRQDGCIILSGAIDALDTKNHLGHDWKTKGKVGPYTRVSESWQQQLTQYSFLARLHGHQVDGFKVSAMDATGVVVLDVELPDQESWVKNYLIPRARELARHQTFSAAEVIAFNEGLTDAPPGFPEPRENYLCNGANPSGKIYCPVKNQCIKWRT